MRRCNILMAVFIFVPASCHTFAKDAGIVVHGTKNPVLSLNGTWKFSMQPPEKFWQNSVDFQGWADIRVPGECQMQGFAIKHDRPYVYKHEFTIPKDFKEKQIQLDFYGVYSYARVWVNGVFVREHFGGFTRWSCDITKLVTPGEKAVLTLEFVDRSDDISYGSGYAKHQIGGILRDVELSAFPKQHFKKLYFETEFDTEYCDADLKIFYELSQDTPATIKVELFDAQNNSVKSIKKENVPQSGLLSIAVENPKKWDAEHPHLYKVATTLFENGIEILQKSEKIGFRDIVIDGNRLLVNGKPVKLRGANRHDIHPMLGRLTTPAYDLKDVLLAKECNMNFIRTSHYPPSEQFLHYCDEFGIYVEDETAVCFVGSHRTETYRTTGATQSAPEFTPRYLSQLEEMVQHHRNHPCVIMWSIGNENRFGDNFVKSFKWIKKNDPTRPVIYSYPGQVPDSLRIYDIISMHYPSWRGDLEQYGVATQGFCSQEKPMLFDEWAHVACYNNFELKEDPNVRTFWGGSLDRMWNTLFEADGALGGAIWCMIDETFMLPKDLAGFNEWWGILDKNVIPATYMGPTVGYGEWGIVDTWRRKKPEFWATKKAYSPTKIDCTQIMNYKSNEGLTLPVHNRFDHTNFNELKIIWRYGEQSGEINKIDLEPHQKGKLFVPANDWNVEEKLNIQFFQNDTFLVDEYYIQLGEKEINLPICRTGRLIIEESTNQINISGKTYTLEVNRQNGLIENLKVDQELMIQSGPYIHLQVPGEVVQYSTIKMEDYAQNWRLENFDFKVVDGIANISSSGSCDKISATFIIKIDENGSFNIDYQIKNAPTDKNIQRAGIKFLTGENFVKLSWNRDAYFSAYPEDHPGRPAGIVDIRQKPDMIYRQKPQHTWELDSKGFYYFGHDVDLPYTNIVRALKENIYCYSLITADSSKISVVSPGTQACRFDFMNGKNALIINDQWDYNSLLWGNYSKNIRCEDMLTGKVFLKIKSH